ncbi:MAG: NADH-quinone oxidoreductase subunit [Thermoplasmata archaeon]|jgi:NADH-quinone oxidoreductase subunit J|nr:NADH-quinone oxidoreductase subunit [Thermoplasmata archaeon]
MSPDLGETIAFGTIAFTLLASALASSMVKRTFHSVMFLGVTLVAAAALYILLGSALVGVIQILVYVGGILTLFIFAVMFVSGDEATEAIPPTVAPRSRAWSTMAGIAVALVALVVFFLYAHRAYNVAYNRVPGVGGEILGFVLGLVFLGAVVVAAIVAWIGIDHVLRAWTWGRIVGGAVAAALFGLMVGVTMAVAPWAGSATEATQAAANDIDGIVAVMFGPQVIALEVLGILLTAVMIGALVIARPMGVVADESHYQSVTAEQVRESQRVSEVPK